MRQRVFVWDDFELNYNQSTIVLTSLACNEFLCGRNDQIEPAVHEGFHHSNLPLWIPRVLGNRGVKVLGWWAKNVFCSRSFASKHLQVSSEVQYACWKHMSNKIKGWRGRICCANVLGARFFGSIVDFPFCLPDTWFNLSSVSLPWEDGNQNSRPFLIISEQTKTRFVMECKNIYCNFNWTGSVHSRFTLGLRCKLEEHNPNPATVNRPTLTIHPTWPALTLGNKYILSRSKDWWGYVAASDIFRGAWKGADRI